MGFPGFDIPLQPGTFFFRQPARITRPVVLKTVGCAAWDLAACRVAREVLSEETA